MAKAKLRCKTCGKEYEACRTPNTGNVFRWRDVACSVECAMVYIDLVEKARTKNTAGNTDKKLNEQ